MRRSARRHHTCSPPACSADAYPLLRRGAMLLSDSRADLTATSQRGIEVGKTTRVDVLFVMDAARRRTNVTGAREALRGYQKGHRFYCFDSLSRLSGVPDVDRFFPHRLKEGGFKSIDGVWNLVLACSRCNRGAAGKSTVCQASSRLKD